jgi:hypothetical protein
MGPRPGATGSIDATTNDVVVAQANATHGVNLYALELIIYRTSPLTTTSTSPACREIFRAMVGSFVLPHTASSGVAAPAPYALTDPVNPAVQYAETTWNWWNYTGSCCAPENSGQPDFACAEYVARSLSTQGLMPGLNTNSMQGGGVDVWDTGPTSPQNFNYYSYYGAVFRLLDTGTSTITGLYQYLINNGLGMNVGDDPAGAVPGDVVFYSYPDQQGQFSVANMQHTAILVATGTTPGGGDTLIDEHNVAGQHWGYASIGWYDSNHVFHLFARTLVHLNMNEAFAPAIGKDINGYTTVFARGSGSHIYALTQSANGAWPTGSWVSLGGVATSDPVYGTDISNRPAVFVRGTDNAIYTQVENADGTWPSNWTRLGGVAVGNPAFGHDVSGRPAVFIRGTDNRIWDTIQNADGTWPPYPAVNWTPLGGIATSPPVYGRDISNRPAIFIRGTDNRIWDTVQNYDGTWPPYPAVNWTSLGAVATSDPAFGRDVFNHPAIFVRSGDSAIWVTVENSNATWPGDPWLRLGIG